MIFAQKCPQEASERSFRECASVAPQNTARSCYAAAAVLAVSRANTRTDS